MRDYHPLLELNLLSLLCVNEALFHPVFDCVVFSFAALIPICSGQKRLQTYPGSDNQCAMLCSKTWASEVAVRMKRRETNYILRYNQKELVKVECGL